MASHCNLIIDDFIQLPSLHDQNGMCKGCGKFVGQHPRNASTSILTRKRKLTMVWNPETDEFEEEVVTDHEGGADSSTERTIEQSNSIGRKSRPIEPVTKKNSRSDIPTIEVVREQYSFDVIESQRIPSGEDRRDVSSLSDDDSGFVRHWTANTGEGREWRSGYTLSHRASTTHVGASAQTMLPERSSQIENEGGANKRRVDEL